MYRSFAGFRAFNFQTHTPSTSFQKIQDPLPVLPQQQPLVNRIYFQVRVALKVSVFTAPGHPKQPSIVVHGRGSFCRIHKCFHVFVGWWGPTGVGVPALRGLTGCGSLGPEGADGEWESGP